jgi:hypothetical protein
MVSFKRPIEPYIVPLDSEELSAYQRLRVEGTRPSAAKADPVAA